MGGSLETSGPGRPAEIFQEMTSGSKVLSTKIVKVVDARHPARVFEIPDKLAFGLVATKAFEEDEPIMPYHGQLITEQQASADNI